MLKNVHLRFIMDTVKPPIQGNKIRLTSRASLVKLPMDHEFLVKITDSDT